MPDQTSEEDRWINFTPTEYAVILFVLSNDQILLIHKKRGLGHGKINGPGGRLEPGETAYQAAVRETREEVGIVAENLSETAHLQFQFSDGYSLDVTVFVSREYTGELVETDEALPFWESVTSIPYDRMWADDRLWLPEVLAGRYVNGRFYFDDDVMLESSLSVSSRP